MDTTFFSSGIVFAQISFSHLSFVAQLLGTVLPSSDCAPWLLANSQEVLLCHRRPGDLADNYHLVVPAPRIERDCQTSIHPNMGTNTLLRKPLPRFLDVVSGLMKGWAAILRGPRIPSRGRRVLDRASRYGYARQV